MASSTAICMARAHVFQALVEDLAASIRSGELSEGARLPSERDLALRYGVSRTSVREALLSLEAMGLIEIKDRARAQVRMMRSETLLDPLAGAVQTLLATPAGLVEAQGARMLFECGLARYAAQYASPKEIERLGWALLENRCSLGKLDQFIATDVAFHKVLAHIPHNGVFVGLNAALSDWLVARRRAGLQQQGSVRALYGQHEQIFEAIASRSPTAAETAMSAHLAFAVSLQARP